MNFDINCPLTLNSVLIYAFLFNNYVDRSPSENTSSRASIFDDLESKQDADSYRVRAISEDHVALDRKL